MDQWIGRQFLLGINVFALFSSPSSCASLTVSGNCVPHWGSGGSQYSLHLPQRGKGRSNQMKKLNTGWMAVCITCVSLMIRPLSFRIQWKIHSLTPQRFWGDVKMRQCWCLVMEESLGPGQALSNISVHCLLPELSISPSKMLVFAWDNTDSDRAIFTFLLRHQCHKLSLSQLPRLRQALAQVCGEFQGHLRPCAKCPAFNRGPVWANG